MSRFLLDHARPGDDAALRGVMARTPMDGRTIALSFRREPSFLIRPSSTDSSVR